MNSSEQNPLVDSKVPLRHYGAAGALFLIAILTLLGTLYIYDGIKKAPPLAKTVTPESHVSEVRTIPAPSHIRAIIPSEVGGNTHVYAVSDTDTIHTIFIDHRACDPGSYEQRKEDFGMHIRWTLSDDKTRLFYLVPESGKAAIRVFDIRNNTDKLLETIEMQQKNICSLQLSADVGTSTLQVTYETEEWSRVGREPLDYFLSSTIDTSEYIVVPVRTDGPNALLFAVDRNGHIANYCESIASADNHLCGIAKGDAAPNPLDTIYMRNVQLLNPLRKMLYADRNGWLVTDIETFDPMYIAPFAAEGEAGTKDTTRSTEYQDGLVATFSLGPRAQAVPSENGQYVALFTTYYSYDLDEGQTDQSLVSIPTPTNSVSTVEIYDVFTNTIVHRDTVKRADADDPSFFQVKLSTESGEVLHTINVNSRSYTVSGGVATETQDISDTDPYTVELIATKNEALHKAFYAETKRKLVHTFEESESTYDGAKVLFYPGSEHVSLYRFNEQSGVYDVLIEDITVLPGYVPPYQQALQLYGQSQDGRYLGFFHYWEPFFSGVSYLDTHNLDQGFITVGGGFVGLRQISPDGTKILGVTEEHAYMREETDATPTLFVFDLNTATVTPVYTQEDSAGTFLMPEHTYVPDDVDLGVPLVRWVDDTAIEIVLVDEAALIALEAAEYSHMQIQSAYESVYEAAKKLGNSLTVQLPY